MLSTCVDLQTLEHLSAELVLGQHSLDGQFDNSFWLSFLHASIRNLFEVSGVLTVTPVDLLFSLKAGNFDQLGVGHNDKIAREHVRHVRGLVFAHQECRHLSCESAENLTTGVYDLPVVDQFSGFWVVML